MNWYRVIKLALPVVNVPREMDYTDIGHYDKMEHFRFDKVVQEILWTIDYNFDIKTIPVTDMNIGTIHDYAFDLDFSYRSKDSIASGRYIKHRDGSGKTSVAINVDPDTTNPRSMEYIKKQVSNILDREFNNPAIYEF